MFSFQDVCILQAAVSVRRVLKISSNDGEVLEPSLQKFLITGELEGMFTLFSALS